MISTATNHSNLTLSAKPQDTPGYNLALPALSQLSHTPRICPSSKILASASPSTSGAGTSAGTAPESATKYRRFSQNNYIYKPAAKMRLKWAYIKWAFTNYYNW